MSSDIKEIQNSLIETSNILGSVLGLTGELGASTHGQATELSQTVRSIEENTRVINHIAEIGSKAKDSAIAKVAKATNVVNSYKM
jgi:hypothetical protein